MLMILRHISMFSFYCISAMFISCNVLSKKGTLNRYRCIPKYMKTMNFYMLNNIFVTWFNVAEFQWGWHTVSRHVHIYSRIYYCSFSDKGDRFVAFCIPFFILYMYNIVYYGILCILKVYVLYLLFNVNKTFMIYVQRETEWRRKMPEYVVKFYPHQRPKIFI